MIDDNECQSSLQSCTELKGVGTKIAAQLKKLNISTLQDLLFHLPLRYENRTIVKKLNQLRFGDQTQVIGKVTMSEIQLGRRRSLVVKIQDDTGWLTLRFFYFNSKQKDLFVIGRRVNCFGEIRKGPTGYEMIHPEYRFLQEDQSIELPDLLTPIYPATEGINQHVFRKLTDQALTILTSTNFLSELLPKPLLQQLDFPELKDAICTIHRPKTIAAASVLNLGQHPCQQRLVFEELLAHQLSLVKLRSKTKKLSGFVINPSIFLEQKFLDQLPYQLTSAQRKVLVEIKEDLANASPMLRLVQGDVGSGKTVVAAISALNVVENNLQVAVMAPTELLAEQHYKNFLDWFAPLQIKVGYLTSSLAHKQKEGVLSDLKDGKLQVIIGTHALFQEQVTFKKLGLVIIDEQHRFGVDQRLSLLSKGVVAEFYPHQLIMSATPIPRTLAMTAYGDLDCSIIDELPPGRTPIQTIVMSQTKRPELIERIRVNCQQGAQAYWVCTLIQESDVLQCQAAEEITKQLESLLPELNIGLVHGRMKAKEKEATMLAFKQQNIDLLVATTVIEVGVDVPNASLMIIENPERLGLSQLHQLRGRVGRGAAASYCVLLYQPPLSKLAEERLGVLRESCDGFIIAEKDLELRGPGEIIGKKQTGLMQLRIANLVRDQHHLPVVQQTAESLMKDYPEMVDAIIQRWLADNTRFTDV